MKKLISLLGAIAISTIVAMAGPQVIVVGYGSPAINIIDIESKQILWQYEMPIKTDNHCNSVQLLADGEHIAFTSSTSAQVVSIKTKEVVWEYRPEGGKAVAEVHSIVPLEKGGFAVFVATYPVLVMEVSADFKVTRELHFTELTGAKKPHNMFRVVTMSKDGNYLLPWVPAKGIYKMSREGEIITEYPANGAFCPIEMRNGNFIFGTNDRGAVVVYNPKTDSVEHEITSFHKDGERAWIQYTGQCELIGKDQYMMTNWTGHSFQPHHQANKTDFLPVFMIVNGEGEILWHYTMEEANEDLKFIKGTTGFYYSKKAIIK